jgi:hypothetical protein
VGITFKRLLGVAALLTSAFFGGCAKELPEYSQRYIEKHHKAVEWPGNIGNEIDKKEIRKYGFNYSRDLESLIIIETGKNEYLMIKRFSNPNYNDPAPIDREIFDEIYEDVKSRYEKYIMTHFTESSEYEDSMPVPRFVCGGSWFNKESLSLETAFIEDGAEYMDMIFATESWWPEWNAPAGYETFNESDFRTTSLNYLRFGITDGIDISALSREHSALRNISSVQVEHDGRYSTTTTRDEVDEYSESTLMCPVLLGFGRVRLMANYKEFETMLNNVTNLSTNIHDNWNLEPDQNINTNVSTNVSLNEKTTAGLLRIQFSDSFCCYMLGNKIELKGEQDGSPWIDASVSTYGILSSFKINDKAIVKAGYFRTDSSGIEIEEPNAWLLGASGRLTDKAAGSIWYHSDNVDGELSFALVTGSKLINKLESFQFEDFTNRYIHFYPEEFADRRKMRRIYDLMSSSDASFFMQGSVSPPVDDPSRRELWWDLELGWVLDSQRVFGIYSRQDWEGVSVGMRASIAEYVEMSIAYLDNKDREDTISIGINLVYYPSRK